MIKNTNFSRKQVRNEKREHESQLSALDIENAKLNERVTKHEEQIDRQVRNKNVIKRDEENAVAGISFYDYSKYVRNFIKKRLQFDDGETEGILFRQ